MSCGFWSYGRKYVRTKVFDIFPVPEKKHENEAKIKVTIIIGGISSIYQQFFASYCLASFSSLNILVQTQLDTTRITFSTPSFKYRKRQKPTKCNKCAMYICRHACFTFVINGFVNLARSHNDWKITKELLCRENIRQVRL